MMPSRGLRALRGITPPSRQLHTRNLSFIRTGPGSSILRTAAPSSSRPLLRYTGAVLSAYSVRNASSTSTPTLTPTPTPTPAPESTPLSTTTTTNTPITPIEPTSSNIPNIDTLTLDDIDFSSATAIGPEQIGYLRELGMDFGWGPASFVQWSLEHIHVWGDLPWWGAIAASAIIFRLATFPLFVKSAHSSARSAALHTVFEPINKRMQQHQRDGNSAGTQQEMQNYWVARQQAGIKITDSLYPVIAQAVFGFCHFKVLRAMAEIPVPGLKDGGFLWITDLTMTDGYLVLPALMAVTMHLMVRLGGETGSTTALAPGMQKFMFYGMPAILFMFTAWQPAALAVYFFASTSWSALQGLLLQSPTARKFLGIAPKYVRPASAGPAPSMMDSFMGTPSSKAGPDTTARSAPTHTLREWQTPTYQAPTLRLSKDGEIIETKLVDSSTPSAAAEAQADASRPKPSMFDGVKQRFEEYKEKRIRHLEAKAKEEAVKKAFEKHKSRE